MGWVSSQSWHLSQGLKEWGSCADVWGKSVSGKADTQAVRQEQLACVRNIKEASGWSSWNRVNEGKAAGNKLSERSKVKVTAGRALQVVRTSASTLKEVGVTAGFWAEDGQDLACILKGSLLLLFKKKKKKKTNERGVEVRGSIRLSLQKSSWKFYMCYKAMNACYTGIPQRYHSCSRAPQSEYHSKVSQKNFLVSQCV